ncbi:MAG TPA: hypothetical protein VEU30_16715, partial [Thermoanaerobaculia bacterium]|nr:hypothetical protein [Thermoanaerobaculia bacterium]
MPTSRSSVRSARPAVASLLDRLARHPDLDLARVLLEQDGVLQELGIGEGGERAHIADLPIELGVPPGALTVFRKGEPAPRFVITKAKVHQPNRISLNVEIAGGTIWIALRSLDGSWPGNTYAGFTVEKGTLHFTRNGNVFKAGHKDGRITYEDEVDFVLDAKPATIKPAGTLCPAKPSVNGPESVHIEWKNAKPAAFAIGKASATFAGQTIDVDETTSKPSLESGLAAIVFPATLSPATWDAAQLDSDLVSFSGTTKLHGGWALSIVDALQNGDALNPGFFLFRCPNTLHANWGGGEGELDLPSAAISVSEGKFILLQQAGAAEPLTRTLRIWAVREEENAPRLPLTLSFGGPKQSLAYVCDSLVGESLLASCGAEVAIDRPVTIHGRPLELTKSDEAWLAVEKKNGKTRVRVVALDRIAYRRPGVLLALRNAIVPSSQPLVVALDGTLSDGGLVDAGTLTLTLVASGWLPTLPDPYVGSSLLPKISGQPETVPFPKGKLTLLAATVTWTAPPLPVVSFDGTLSAALGAGSPQTKDPTRPLQQDPDQIRVPTQTAQGDELPQGFQLKPKDVLADRAAMNPPPHGLRLLDVSTNKDLLGVEAAREQTQFAVRALDVCTPASTLRVFALPQVQWEPVRTLDRDQDVDLGHFPTPLASVTDGGATLLGVASQQLVPAIPDLAVDVFLDEFEAGRKAVLATTLPFGLKAVLELRPADTLQPVKRKRDTIRRNEPEFVDPDMRGGAQLSFIAESGPSGRRQSSHFDGGAWQVLNGVALATGAPLNISVLGSTNDPTDSIEALFNNEFKPGLPTARVPVTRLDVSGYGGSCFSEWINQDAAFADAARVQFNVLVGRTALEIVKFATVLYPWGVRLTRSVTIERRGGGGVIRRDTGWQPAS